MTDPSPVLDCWFLTGPTAGGKTSIGVELAHRIGAEIISLDSMAIYRGMDIGTAKPSMRQRRGIPHHLIDIVDPEEEFSVFRYVRAAQTKIAEARRRDRQVLFVGGTPLYLKAMLRGMFRGPGADWEFRQQVEAELQHLGPEALYERVALVDPLSAARLHPHDTRRLIRALEVHKTTGRPISHLQMQFEEGTPADKCRVFVLDWPRTTLHARIDRRVDAMFAAGLVDEVRRLTTGGRQLGRTACQAVGYREVLDLLEGRCPLEVARERIKTRTRRFAKRQYTWFRGLSECRGVPVSAATGVADAVEHILDLARRSV